MGSTLGINNLNCESKPLASGFAAALGVATAFASATVLACATVVAALATALPFATVFSLAIMFAGIGGGRISARRVGHVIFRRFGTTIGDDATSENSGHRRRHEDCPLSSIHKF